MYLLIFAAFVAVGVDADRCFGVLLCFGDYEVLDLDSGTTWTILEKGEDGIQESFLPFNLVACPWSWVHLTK